MLKYMGLAKYMHTNGDPVAYPLPVKLALRTEVLACAFTLAAIFAVLPEEKIDIKKMAGSMSIPIALIAIRRQTFKQKCNVHFGSRVIHTQPTEEEKIASKKFQLKAAEIRNDDFKLVVMAVGLTAAVSTATKLQIPPDFLPVVSLYLGFSSSIAYRFDKVAKGEWAFVEEPKKEDALAHLKKEKKDAAPIALPVPQAI